MQGLPFGIGSSGSGKKSAAGRVEVGMGGVVALVVALGALFGAL